MFIMYTNASSNTPSYIHIHHMWYEESMDRGTLSSILKEEQIGVELMYICCEIHAVGIGEGGWSRRGWL